MIFIPPRHGKSELSSRRFPAWYLGKHPNDPLITASYGQDLASDFGREVRNIVDSDLYHEIFPNISLSSDASAAHKWTIAGHRGEYFAVGVGTATTGRGAKVLLIDDPHKNREEADSFPERQRVWDWYRSTAFTRLMPQGSIVLIMTRWHDDDLAGRLLKQAENDPNIPPWEVLSLSADEPDDDDPLGRGPGEALWPSWYDEAALKEIRAVLGDREYNALYLQKPTTDEGDYFQLEWFKSYTRAELPPHPELRYYGCSDYATSTRRSADYTVHLVFAVDTEDKIYVIDLWRERLKPKDWIENVIDLMKKYKPSQWNEERGQILNSVGPFLTDRMGERKVYCYREQFTPSRDKTVRARAIQGRAQMGMIYIPKNAPWRGTMLDELVKFPAGTHDDIVDCFSLLGLALENVRGGKRPKAHSEDIVPRTRTFDEMIKRSTQRAKGRGRTSEAPIMGHHGPIELEDNENYWMMTGEER
jgi:predicted phage terminase large subunit-like protein